MRLQRGCCCHGDGRQEGRAVGGEPLPDRFIPAKPALPHRTRATAPKPLGGGEHRSGGLPGDLGPRPTAGVRPLGRTWPPAPSSVHGAQASASVLGAGVPHPRNRPLRNVSLTLSGEPQLGVPREILRSRLPTRTRSPGPQGGAGLITGRFRLLEAGQVGEPGAWPTASPPPPRGASALPPGLPRLRPPWCPHGPASLTGAVPVLEGEGERWLGPGALEGASGARFAEGSPCGLPVLVVGVEIRTCVVPPTRPRAPHHLTGACCLWSVNGAPHMARRGDTPRFLLL